MIYAYTFTPNFKGPVNGSPQTIELGDFAAVVPSSEFLLTCRHVEQEATVIFRAAQRSFWSGNTVFSVDLNDDWESDDARKERHFEVLDLLDDAFLFPGISDEQVNAMENLAITVKSEIRTFEVRFVGRIHNGTRHWVMDPNSRTLLRYSNDNVFERALMDTHHQSAPYLHSTERTGFTTAYFAKVPSGRRYKRSARSDLQIKLAARRAELAANPPSTRSSSVKKRQLVVLLQHFWIVYRARRAV